MFAVIDVGSNSVRLMFSDGIKTEGKQIQITRLAEGLAKTGFLCETAAERSAKAVLFFVNLAKERGIDDIFIFATASVRQSKNPELFLDKVKAYTGLKVDVISGEQEAKIGVLGAVNGEYGGIIDVGGASAEVTVIRDGVIEYARSLDAGAVRLTETFGQDRRAVEKYIDQIIDKYGVVPNTKFYGIGGTATTIGAIMQELEPYDPEKTDGFIFSKNDLLTLIDKMYSMSVEERKKLKGLQPQRAEIITAGSVLLYKIMDYSNIHHLIVSEKDNMEGYLKVKLEKI
jgi:exopolyphosphatase/guanosine-5'-triphosphate,3'-diphosphate pyrophosphatase